jgi:hypothetical protein
VDILATQGWYEEARQLLQQIIPLLEALPKQVPAARAELARSLEKLGIVRPSALAVLRMITNSGSWAGGPCSAVERPSGRGPP